MMTLKIDPEFKDLIPPLTEDEYVRLEKSIFEDGCRDPLVTWDDTLVDGHNRYEICSKNDIPFKTVKKDFKDRDDVKLWILENQLGRRNMNKFCRIEVISKCEDAVRAKAEQRMLAGKADPKENFPEGQSRDILGAMAGVSGKTYEHAVEVIKKAPTEMLQKLRLGEMSIDEAYKAIKAEEKKLAKEEPDEEPTPRLKEAKFMDLLTTTKKYRVVYADPPWRLGGSDKRWLQDICDVPVPTEEDAVLFIWVPSSVVPDSMAVINAWGFKYKASFVWNKEESDYGHFNSVKHEFLFVCTKGSCEPDTNKMFDSIQTVKRGEDPCKPEEFRDIIDVLYPYGDRIELYANEAPSGWDAWNK